MKPLSFYLPGLQEEVRTAASPAVTSGVGLKWKGSPVRARQALIDPSAARPSSAASCEERAEAEKGKITSSAAQVNSCTARSAGRRKEGSQSERDFHGFRL